MCIQWVQWWLILQFLFKVFYNTNIFFNFTWPFKVNGSCVAYWPLTEPSVGHFSSRMHLCKFVEEDALVEPEMPSHWEIIYTRVSTADRVSLVVGSQKRFGQSRAPASANQKAQIWHGALSLEDGTMYRWVKVLVLCVFPSPCLSHIPTEFLFVEVEKLEVCFYNEDWFGLASLFNSISTL